VYYLAVVTRRPRAQPVVSQRVIHAIDQAVTEKGLAGVAKKSVMAVSLDADMDRWLRARLPGASLAAPAVADGKVPADVVVIGSADKLPAGMGEAALVDFVKAGGRVIVLSQAAWTMKTLADFEPVSGPSSRAFAYPHVKHAMLAGVDPEYLKRWNGLPGTVAQRYVKGLVVADPSKVEKLLWAENPSRPVAARLSMGKGEVMICLLDFRNRLDKSDKSYDPVAERVLLNLLAFGPSQPARTP
jgi:hypothetical protein